MSEYKDITYEVGAERRPHHHQPSESLNAFRTQTVEELILRLRRLTRSVGQHRDFGGAGDTACTGDQKQSTFRKTASTAPARGMVGLPIENRKTAIRDRRGRRSRQGFAVSVAANGFSPLSAI